NNVAAVVIPQDAEVSKVAVLIVDQGVKHQHTADLLGKLRPQLVVVGKAGGNAPGSDNAPDGDIGRVDVGKQGALRSGNAFPVLQVIMHGVQAHGFRNLRSIILAVRLPARIGRAGRAALVEINPIVLQDRKSTRLNSSHVSISYAVFCLKKKSRYKYSSTPPREHQPPQPVPE